MTIGTGKSKFSTGFDLEKWAESSEMIMRSYLQFQGLCSRIIQLPIPTLCVMNGKSLSGGLIFAFAHDFRIMADSPKSYVQLTELMIGLPIPPSILHIIIMRT